MLFGSTQSVSTSMQLVSLLLPVRTILQLLLSPGVELEFVHDAILPVPDHVPLNHRVDNLVVLPLFLGLARLQCLLLPAVISAII